MIARLLSYPVVVFVALGASVLLGAGPAHAQWPTTDWEVRCIIVPEDLRQYCDGPEGLEAQMRSEFVRYSKWLQGIGFRKPVLDLENGRYVARFNNDAQSRTGLARYEPDTRRILLSTGIHPYYPPLPADDAYTDFSSKNLLKQWDIPLKITPVDPPILQTVIGDGVIEYLEGFFFAGVHELYHAITFSYVDIRPTVESHRWIWEGTAEAVRYAWAERYGTIKMARRYFDFPLNQPRYAPSKSDPNGIGEAYDSGVFWYHLGGDIESPHRISYLQDLLKALEQDVGAGDDGVSTVYRALEPFGGMYNLYPQFVARHLQTDRHFLTVKPLRLRAGDEFADPEALYDPIEPLTTRAYTVYPIVPSGEHAALSIRIREDHPDLHLIVDGDRRDQEPVRTGERGTRNTYRRTLTGTGAPDSVRIRIAHAPKTAETLTPRPFVLDVSLEPVDADFAFQTTGAALLNEFGDVQMFNGTPHDGGCLITVRLAEDLYGPSVKMTSFMPDGLQPGTYPVGRNYTSLERGVTVSQPYDPSEIPRSAPETFFLVVGTWDAADTNNSHDDFLSETGTVTVERTGERAVSMTFDAQLVEDDHEMTGYCSPITEERGLCTIPERRRLGVSGSLAHTLRPERKHLGSWDWYGCRDGDRR